MTRKILAITGIRSEYDILYPVISRLRIDPAFDVSVVVSSAHLSDWHGNTAKAIEADGFRIADRIDSLLMTNRTTQRPKGVGLLITALSQTVERENPDYLLVVGDREESIATSIVGNYMEKLVAHIGGGDPVFGNADDPIRMAVSKLSHIHFVTAKDYGKNLERMGEEPFRIFFSGNPALRNIKDTLNITLDALSEHLNFDISDGRYIVLVKHPLSSEHADAYTQMFVTLRALESFSTKHNFKVVASYPNTDPGSYDILNAIREFEGKSFIKFNRTLSRDYFVNLMRNAKALVGNSSMGILEAPFYKLPVVNVGNRQQGRLNAGNVEFVGYNEGAIVTAIERACFNEAYRNSIAQLECPFGDGTAPELIANTLKSIDITDRKWFLKKKLC